MKSLNVEDYDSNPYEQSQNKMTTLLVIKLSTLFSLLGDGVEPENITNRRSGGTPQSPSILFIPVSQGKRC